MTEVFVSSAQLDLSSLNILFTKYGKEQSHSGSAVNVNLWLLGREERKGFFSPVAEGMKKLSIACC